MGCQGEIYNIYGIIVPASLEDEETGTYKINGHTIEANLTVDLDLKNPKLAIRVLGHDMNLGSRHFKGKALVGYIVANESYLNSASPLPEMSIIKSFRLNLHRDIDKKLGLKVDPEEFKLYLLFDYING